MKSIISTHTFKIHFFLFLIVSFQFNAHAQCKTFANADAANPLLAAVPAGKTVNGFDFVDIDGDGDKDCYVMYEGDTTINFFLNTGNAHHPVFIKQDVSGFETLSTPISSGYMQFVDFDGDGDFDLYLSDYKPLDSTSGAHIRYYQNTGTSHQPHFIENENSNITIGLAGNFIAVPFKFADIDNNGLIDLYHAGNETYKPNDGYYLNDGYRIVSYNYGPQYNPTFGLFGRPDGTLTEKLFRTYYDWNQDGLLDYFAYSDTSVDYLYRDKSGSYYSDPFNAPIFTNGTPYQMVDLNGDGAPEVFSRYGHYSTLAPISILTGSTTFINGKVGVMLASKNTCTSYTYQWEHNNTIIDTAKSSTLFPKLAGTYTLYVTDSCGTGVSLPYNVLPQDLGEQLVTDTTAQTTTNASVKVMVFANPFKTSATLVLPSTTGVTSIKNTVQVIDMTGRVMQTQSTSANTITIGQNLPQGIYILRVFQRNKIIYHKMIQKL